MIPYFVWYVRYVRLPIVEGMADQNAQPILLKTANAGPKTVEPCCRSYAMFERLWTSSGRV